MRKCLREPKHFIFSLFVVTVTVTHPTLCEMALLFLLSPWIKRCCHSWLALNHLPLLPGFEGGFIGFLSHSCAEIDLVFKLTSAGKIKIDMACLGLSLEGVTVIFAQLHFCTVRELELKMSLVKLETLVHVVLVVRAWYNCGRIFECYILLNFCTSHLNPLSSTTKTLSRTMLL